LIERIEKWTTSKLHKTFYILPDAHVLGGVARVTETRNKGQEQSNR